MKKKATVIVLSAIMLFMSVLEVFAAETYEEWDDDWTNAPASAYGSAYCTEGWADADANCYSNSSVIELSVYVSGSFTYMNSSTGVFTTVSDCNTDSGSSNAQTSVEFSVPSGCTGTHIGYSYTASYSAYYQGAVYGDSCNGSGEVWATH